MLKGFLLTLVFLIPFPIGFVFHKKDKTITCGTFLKSYLYGLFSMWAAFQILAVPMILLKTSFTLLVVSFSILMAAAVAFGIIRIIKSPKNFKFKIPIAPIIWIMFLVAIILIGFQAYKYFLSMHIDQDDARYLGEANDAYYYNKMLLYQPETGEYVGNFSRIPTKDIYSPWPIYLAALSTLTATIPAALAHTYYAPLLLVISYLAYACMGARLFKGTSERIIFLFLVAVVHLYFAGPAINEGTPPVHTLTRIWQGKGVVEAVAIPAIIYQLLTIQEDNSPTNWIILTVMCCGSCLLSGLGIILSLTLIGVFGIYIICCKRFKSILWFLLSIAPAGIFELIYYLNAY